MISKWGSVFYYPFLVPHSVLCSSSKLIRTKYLLPRRLNKKYSWSIAINILKPNSKLSLCPIEHRPGLLKHSLFQCTSAYAEGSVLHPLLHSGRLFPPGWLTANRQQSALSSAFWTPRNFWLPGWGHARGTSCSSICMCSWGKQGEIQIKRAVLLPVPGAYLLGNVTLSNSLSLWQLLHLKASEEMKPHIFTWVRANGDGTKSFWEWRRWIKHIQPSNPSQKITFTHLLIFWNSLHTEVSITALLSNCYNDCFTCSSVRLQHVPFFMALFVTIPGHGVESFMFSADKKALDYKIYPNI